MWLWLYCAVCEQKLLKVADLEAFHEQESWAAFREFVVTNSNFQLHTFACLRLAALPAKWKFRTHLCMPDKRHKIFPFFAITTTTFSKIVIWLLKLLFLDLQEFCIMDHILYYLHIHIYLCLCSTWMCIVFNFGSKRCNFPVL